MENLPERIDSKFRYVLLAAQRAEQMMHGAVPKVEMAGHKLSRIAMQEIMEDRIEWGYGPPEEPEVELEEAAASEDK